MKGQSFRDKKIGNRLRKASADWKKARPENRFEKPTSKWRQWLNYILGASFLIVLPLGIVASAQDPTAAMAFLLPLVAGITFSSMFARYADVRYDERSALLPLSSAQVQREIFREWRNEITLTLLWIIGLGSLLYQGASPAEGAVKCLLLFLSMTLFMSLSLLPRMVWLSGAVIWTFGALFILTWVDILGGALIEQVASYLPWHEALSRTPESWAYLGGVLIAGIAALMVTKRLWLSRPDFDCTYYYEHLHGFNIEDPMDIDLDDEALETLLPPPPVTPKGRLESFVWRFLSDREKALTRAAGLCSETFLSRWLITTIFLSGMIYLWDLFTDWSLFFPILGTITGLVWLWNSLNLKAATYLTGMKISPRCAAAGFAILPIGMRTVEKIFYKEGLPKWACLAATITLIIGISFPLGAAVLAGLFPTFFTALVIIHSVAFWVSGTGSWLTRKNRWAWFYSSGIALCFLGMIAVPFSQFFAFLMESIEGNLLSCLPALTVMIGLALIARALMIRMIHDPRCDLLAQSKS